jgi:hypothetical protein
MRLVGGTAYILMTESAPCAPRVLSKMNTMSYLCVQPYPHSDWTVSLGCFSDGRFGIVQNMFEVDRSSGQDWRSVLRETWRYLEVVGGAFKPILMWVLWMKSGTALNLTVMQRLISIITTIAVMYAGAYARWQ